MTANQIFNIITQKLQKPEFYDHLKAVKFYFDRKDMSWTVSRDELVLNIVENDLIEIDGKRQSGIIDPSHIVSFLFVKDE